MEYQKTIEFTHTSSLSNFRAQVWACGVLFLALGLGNLGTTLQTYYQKWQEDGKKRH